MTETTIELAGGAGTAVKLRAGQKLHLCNTHGSQVVDTWALGADDPSEYLSVEHTRRMTGQIYPKAGSTFYSNRRTPMLVLEEDSFSGTHDMLVACCDPWLYVHFEAAPGHASCADNFRQALAEHAITPAHVPNPVNLWMNVPVEGTQIDLTVPLSTPDDYVVLGAKMDVIVVLSACPMDITPVNGADCTPKSVHYHIIGG